MPPRSTLALALCTCVGIAGPVTAQNPELRREDRRAEAMRERFGVPIIAPQKWGEYTLVSIVEEGKAVKKGDLLFQLKSPSLEAKLSELVQKLEEAKAEHASSRLDREVAELRLREFVGGTKRDEIEEVSGEIVLAGQAHKAAGAKLAAVKRAARNAEDPTLTAAEFEATKAGFAYERSLTKRKVLEEFTHPRRQKELEAAVEKAKLAEFRLHAIATRAGTDLKALEEEASRVKAVRAPEDGVVRFLSARGFGGMPGPFGQTRFKAGDTVGNSFQILVLHPEGKDKEQDMPAEKK